MHVVAIGGSDAGISAALRARELDPNTDVTVVVADAYPNFSICGIPYYISGEVARWQNLAHRSYADLEAAGMQLRLGTTATRIDVDSHQVWLRNADGGEEPLAYDRLVVGTGAVPVRPPIDGVTGPGALGEPDGVHLLHTMGDTFSLQRTLDEQRPATALIVGAGYVGLEMAEGLVMRGLKVAQVEALPEVLPTVDPELGTLVPGRAARPRRRRIDFDHRRGAWPVLPRGARAGWWSKELTRASAALAARPTWSSSRSGSGPIRSSGCRRRQDRRAGGGGRRRADAHRATRRLRRRGLRCDPSPAPGRDVPTARHHRSQTGAGGR